MSENQRQDQWQRLNEIFAAAIKAEPGRESTLLEEACNGDERLRCEVEALLSAARKADGRGFLKSDVFENGASVLLANEIPPGTKIGPYCVVRELGRGGMGVVYLALREGFQQQVALKIIKRGMDTTAIVRRFVQERDVLASLNHPNIARLLDGGTTDGLPFIAMEYVEGETITKYCDEHRLTIDQRLSLFRKVCSAVGYAHRNLVVHRDIKPSNILIAKEGEPKLLDFGIAKLLSPDSFDNPAEATMTGANLLTPEYASPEQIRGETVSTASDIYSLGVLLYELLCGHRPFRFKNRLASEVLQIVSERQPKAPSTAASVLEDDSEVTNNDNLRVSQRAIAELRSEKPARLQRKLVGDLDNIVLMALRKEPERRYHSVEQLADDIRRHLEGLPVTARRATFSYRTSKFIERNRMASVFLSVALVAILAGLSISLWQAAVARRQWERAERRSTEVRRLTNTLLKELQGEVGVLPGSDKARKRLSQISIDYLNGLAAETNDPAVLKQLSEAYVQLGKQYGYESGDPDQIHGDILRGLEISRRLVAAAPGDVDAKKLLATNLAEYDFFCEKEPAEKLKLNLERARLWEQILATNPSDGESYSELASAYGTLNYLYRLYEQTDEASKYSRLEIQIREREANLLEKPNGTNHERDLLSGDYLSLGSAYAEELKDVSTAERFYDRALSVAQALIAEHPDYRLGWIRFAAANRQIGELQYREANYRSALDHFQTGLGAIRDATAKLTDAQMRGAEPSYMLHVAESLYRTGQVEQARKMLRDAGEVNAQIIGFGGTETTNAVTNARFLGLSAEVYEVFGETEKALAAYAEAEALWKKVVEAQPQQQTEASLQIARLCLGRADLYAGLRVRTGEARSEYERVVDILSKLKASNQISLGGLNELNQAKQKLQTL